MNNNNNIVALVIAVLGFVALLIFGKWVMDQNRQQPLIGPTTIQLPQHPPQPLPQPQYWERPQNRPEPHHCAEFWQGYRDGYKGRPPMTGCCPEYMAGYRRGRYDRGCCHHDYFDRHCPPNFRIHIDL